MRTTAGIGFVLGLGWLLSFGAGCQPNPLRDKQPLMRRATFVINGLDSQQSVRRITAALRKLPGVETVEVDLPNADARVKFDANLVSEIGLRRAIQDLGFSADVNREEGS
jgi:copper chaperone CopZ